MNLQRTNRASLLSGFSLLFVAILAGVVALRAWAVMILIGIFHAELGLPPHTVGFWVCIPIALLLGLLFGNGITAKATT